MHTITAVATVIIAIIVAFISWQQWVVNREKFRLDLYNRRFAIYLAVVDYRDAIFPSVKVIKLGETQDEFVRRLREARFLFPDESGVPVLLAEFWKKAIEIIQYDRGVSEGMYLQMDSQRRGQREIKDIENNEWMEGFIDRFETLIAPYLNFHGLTAKREL